MKEYEQPTDGQKAGIGRRRPRRLAVLLTVVGLISALMSVAAPTVGAQEARVIVNEGESIQAAIDAAAPGTTIIVRGDHVENLWINKSGIRLISQGATLTAPPSEPGHACSPLPDALVPLICVTPTPGDGPPAPADYLNGVTISGFSLSDAMGDGIATVFVNNVQIFNNSIDNSGCDGIFVIFATGVYVSRNDVDGSACAGISVNAGSLARINRNSATDSTFNGIAVNDVSRTIVRRNIVENNCIGIGVVDGADQGFGIRAEEFPGHRARITANTANNNNKTCPFGPELTVGLTGIIVAGVDNVLIRNNTADNNASAEASLTAGGIVVSDFPNADGSFNQTTNVTVIGNRAKGNSSADGPLDMRIESEDIRSVKWNHCDVSTPDPSWCK